MSQAITAIKHRAWPHAPDVEQWNFDMAGFTLPGFVLLMLGGRARGKRKRIARLLGMILVLTAMLALPSCGGGGGGGGTPPPPQIIPGTPAGTYPVTVSGTFWVPSTGNVTKTQQITLVVQ